MLGFVGSLVFVLAFLYAMGRMVGFFPPLFRNRSIEPGSEAEWRTLPENEQKRRIRALEIECGLTPSEPLLGPEKGRSGLLTAYGDVPDPTEYLFRGEHIIKSQYLTSGAIRTPRVVIAGDNVTMSNVTIGPRIIDYTNGHACNSCEFIETVDDYGNIRRHVGDRCEEHSAPTEEVIEHYNAQMLRNDAVEPHSMGPGIHVEPAQVDRFKK